MSRFQILLPEGGPDQPQPWGPPQSSLEISKNSCPILPWLWHLICATGYHHYLILETGECPAHGER